MFKINKNHESLEIKILEIRILEKINSISNFIWNYKGCFEILYLTFPSFNT